MSAPDLKLSILMPVRNEGVNIAIMLKILASLIEVPYEVIVVYDSPDDDTVPVVKRMQARYPSLRLIHNTKGEGVTNAISAGLAACRGEYVLLFAVDEIGPVAAIGEMIARMDEGCDMVSATRYAYGGRRLGGSLIGGVLSRTANKVFHYLAGASFTDGTTGIKMFRKEVLERIPIESNPVGWAVVFELAIKAQLAGMRIGEVPVVSVDRLYGGKSTFSLGPWFREYLRWFFWGMGRRGALKDARKAMVRIPHNPVKGGRSEEI